MGPQAVLNNVFMQLGVVFDGFHPTPEEFIAHSDTVVVLGRLNCKTRSSGAAASVKYVHIFTINNNSKLVAFHEYCDAIKFFALR